MTAFDFGANWRAFSANRLNTRALEQARQSLQSLLERETLSGASFLDVGCGSGLFSIAASQLGAESVVGIDVNAKCVDVSRRNAEQFAPGTAISFVVESVLNRQALAHLGCFDIVYAWGSLHHTGSMWEAIENVSHLATPVGLLVLSVYNKHWTSPFWRQIKWFYNQLPAQGKKAMAWAFTGIILVAKLVVTRRNPLIKERGMDFQYDVVDWIGGYPYEYATAREIEEYASTLSLELLKFVPAGVPTGCNEFVFVRRAGRGRAVH